MHFNNKNYLRSTLKVKTYKNFSYHYILQQNHTVWRTKNINKNTKFLFLFWFFLNLTNFLKNHLNNKNISPRLGPKSQLNTNFEKLQEIRKKKLTLLGNSFLKNLTHTKTRHRLNSKTVQLEDKITVVEGRGKRG